jgi:hypothetical protein
LAIPRKPEVPPVSMAAVESILRDTVVKLFQRTDSSVGGATAL